MNKYTRIIVGIFSFLYIFSITISPVMASRAYTYDANGNMTSDGARCYEYNEANQVKRVKHCNNNQPIADYIYDYNGNRIVKKQYNSGTLEKTVISPNDEYDITKLASSSATYTSSYYYANDQLIAKKDPYNNFTYYHNDHLGSASIVTNETGDVVEETTYDPWGEVKSGGTKNKYQYTGQEKDDETGLNYYNARYYDSNIRRFTQPDDILQSEYDPQTINRYAYVRNNPIRYTDPSGHFVFLAVNPWTVAITAAAVISAYELATHPQLVRSAAENVSKSASIATNRIARTADELRKYAEAESARISDTIRNWWGTTFNRKSYASNTPSVPDWGRWVKENDWRAKPQVGRWEPRGEFINGLPVPGTGTWYNPETGETVHPDTGHGNYPDHIDITKPGGGDKKRYEKGTGKEIDPKTGKTN